ncbi:MAG TPA: efflux transporter outer membrane subunit [Burkholderiaceae bacterium]|nr:efflux transporter outer membrane subunit [Burkholderiaceae bacterium]
MLQTCSLMLPLGGCLLSGDMPEPNLVVPAAYDGGPKNPIAAQAALPSLDWWTKFRSRELTALMEEARANNLDIAAAIARIVQADAQARVTGAALLPVVDLNGDATHQQATKTGTKASAANLGRNTYKSGGDIVTNNLTATLNASYEIDFWGKNRAALRNKEELAVASRFDREVVGLTTMVAVANAYFQVLAAQDRLKAAREDIVSATRVLDLIKQRVAAGTASALETAQQESVVDTLRAAVPQLEQSLKQNRTTLAVLMGRSPEQVRIRGGTLASIATPRVTPGLPSELLTQRPDIREAEANLAAANANVYNARAQFLPSITLTGEGGYESAVLKVLLRPESAIYSAAAGLTAPIFHGGELLGNLDLQKGKQDELVQNYRKAVISGFADVEIALDAVRQTSLRVTLQTQVVKSSRQAFDISEQRLREGTIDLVTVLQTQQTLYQAQDVLFQAQLARLQAIVSLYQALGGGWVPEPVEASNAR